MKNQIVQAFRAFFILTVLTGIIYPFVMTLGAQFLFPFQANGSIIYRNGRVVGSDLIGQRFQSTMYFWPRPSIDNYNPLPSGASNLGPTNRTLRDSALARARRIRASNGLPPSAPVPDELLFGSASGVDPHISPESALLQVKRIARARGLDSTGTRAVIALIGRMTEPRLWGVLGEPRVNVLRLNLALDESH